MNLGDLTQQLHHTAALLDTHPDTTDTLRLIQGVENMLAAAKTHLVTEMTDTLAHETAGYATPKAFLRAELGLDTQKANELIAAGPTLKALPELDEAATEGAVSLAHVKHFTYALTHISEPVTREFLPELLDVAVKAEPASLRMITRKLREAVYPDDLDKAWTEGMAKEDLQINPVPDGFHVNGFLNSTTGAKFKTLLQSLTAPTGADDPRTSAQRRVDGLEKLLDSVLNHGLPGDQGVRPHVTITVDADTLSSNEGTGDLIGYGAIGVRQIKEILCGGTIRPVVTTRTARSRFGRQNVGRAMRLATGTQRIAVETAQHHRCAAPGCHNPIIHIHHITWWSHGGATDRDNLIGLCPRCHRAVHAGTLIIDPATHEFRNKHGLRLTRARPRRLTPEHVRRIIQTVT